MSKTKRVKHTINIFYVNENKNAFWLSFIEEFRHLNEYIDVYNSKVFQFFVFFLLFLQLHFNLFICLTLRVWWYRIYYIHPYVIPLQTGIHKSKINMSQTLNTEYWLICSSSLYVYAQEFHLTKWKKRMFNIVHRYERNFMGFCENKKIYSPPFVML